MNIKIYAHKSGPVSKAFLQVFGATDVTLDQVESPQSAEVILLTGCDDLRSLYNERQMFCVIKFPGMPIAQNQPENICFVSVLDLFGPSGFQSLIRLIKKHYEAAPKSVADQKLPEYSDLAQFDRHYSVLVIDDTEQNLRVAESVLRGHEVTVSGSLLAAMIMIDEGSRFDAVLTDMEMPPDKHYSSLNLQRYAIDEMVPYGFAVVLEMTARGMPVAVVTDGNHHDGWVSAMFDHIKVANVNGQNVLFFNDIGKRWDFALKQLLEG